MSSGKYLVKENHDKSFFQTGRFIFTVDVVSGAPASIKAILKGCENALKRGL